MGSNTPRDRRVTAGSRLLDHLLAYAQVGGASLSIEDFDTVALVHEVIAGLSATIQERGMSVTLGFLPRVSADAVGLAQVFQNLIGNSVKFTPPDRAPVVSVDGERGEDGSVAFAVADNGPGVDPAEAPNLFAMFGRGADSSEEGSGIGLAICAKIVGRHGGRMWVEQGAAGRQRLPFHHRPLHRPVVPSQRPRRISAPPAAQRRLSCRFPRARRVAPPAFEAAGGLRSARPRGDHL